MFKNYDNPFDYTIIKSSNKYITIITIWYFQRNTIFFNIILIFSEWERDGMELQMG